MYLCLCVYGYVCFAYLLGTFPGITAAFVTTCGPQEDKNLLDKNPMRQNLVSELVVKAKLYPLCPQVHQCLLRSM